MGGVVKGLCLCGILWFDWRCRRVGKGDEVEEVALVSDIFCVVDQDLCDCRILQRRIDVNIFHY